MADRRYEISVKRGLTFYALQQLLQRVEAIASEVKMHRDKRQTDIEDAIKRTA